jgi:hypothetical protein
LALGLWCKTFFSVDLLEALAAATAAPLLFAGS